MVGARADLPEGTGVADAVVRRIAAGNARDRAVDLAARRRARRALRPVARRGPQAAWTRVAAAVVAAALAGATVLVLSPGARRAVADLLGLRGERIKLVRTPPSAPARPLGEGLDLGKRITLAEARSAVSYPVLVPSDPALGPPDEVYLSNAVPGGQVSLVYRARPGLPSQSLLGAGMLVTEFQASLDRPFIEKLVGAGSRVRGVSVNGSPGFWISGNPHDLTYVEPNGQVISDSVRLAGDVLLWQRGDITLRIESGLSMAQALLVAQGVR